MCYFDERITTFFLAVRSLRWQASLKALCGSWSDEVIFLVWVFRIILLRNKFLFGLLHFYQGLRLVRVWSFLLFVYFKMRALVILVLMIWWLLYLHEIDFFNICLFVSISLRVLKIVQQRIPVKLCAFDWVSRWAISRKPKALDMIVMQVIFGK